MQRSNQTCQRLYRLRKSERFIWTMRCPKQVGCILNELIPLMQRNSRKNAKLFTISRSLSLFFLSVTEFGIFNYIMILLSGLILNAGIVGFIKNQFTFSHLHINSQRTNLFCSSNGNVWYFVCVAGVRM